MNKPKAYAHEAIYDRVEELLRGLPRGPLLDVPAGEGALADRLRAMGFEVSCCDLHPQLFRVENIDIRSGDLDGSLPYDDASFEYIVCVEGLEHIENPANAVREFARLLVVGGTLIISIPNIMNLEERFKWLFFGYTSHFKPISQTVLDRIRSEFRGSESVALHVNPIGYAELRYLLERNGFRLDGVFPDRVKKNTWAFRPIAALIRLVGNFPPKEKLRERWADEMNSSNVLLGGNTLIFKAQKL